ncbi:MAG: hypothetical protein WA277_13780 [Nitrospirota bacterium]
MNDEINKSTERFKACIDKLRDSLNTELANLEKALKDQSGDIHHRVAERQELARELELDKKLCEIYEEIKHYPSWSGRDDWLKYRHYEIDDPKEEKIEHEHHIQFDLGNKHYELVYTDKGSSTGFDGDYFHHTHLRLLDSSGITLIGINISVEIDYIRELKPFSVDAFKPGDWIQDILESYELYQANKKKKEIVEKYDHNKIKDLKDNFDLD